MAERFVLVTVKIATDGRRCRDWLDGDACPFFNHDYRACRLFHVALNDVEVGDDGRFLRAAQCLALDAADLSPADAVARDLGAQHG